MDSQFLFQFPSQGIAGLFAFLNLASGKLPLERHGLVPRALAHQQLALLLDHGGDDPFHKLEVVATRIELAKEALVPRPLQLSLRLLELLTHNFSAVLDKLLIRNTKSGWEMAVDVEFAGDLLMDENRHNNF
jgi:hypothetical protein